MRRISRYRSEMPHELRSFACYALAIVAMATPAPAPSASNPNAAAVSIAWHLEPHAHYASTSQMTHVVSYDMNGTLKALLGSRAQTVTILESRTVALTAGDKDAVNEQTADARRYGGTDPKDNSVIQRSTTYAGTLASDGKRSPDDQPLVDAGDGALAQLPDATLGTGGSWTFSRTFHVERDLGQGTMTYTDTVTKIDTRGGHQIAVIDVKGAGRADLPSDLQAKGFKTAEITLAGSAEFDVTAGLPGAQHYTAHAEWETRPLGVHIGIVFDDTYDATAWTAKSS
jgi:hypothetical protein